MLEHAESKYYRYDERRLAGSWKDKKFAKTVFICSANFTDGNEEVTNKKGNLQIKLTFISNLFYLNQLASYCNNIV